jgi:hypothetical protein
MAAQPTARHRDPHPRSLAFSLVAIGLAAACASGGMEYSWARPDMGPLHFRDVVTVAVTPSSARRRMMEEAMAGEIHRIAPNVQVETEVYSTAGEGELVYSAISRAVDPTSPADLVRKVGAIVASDMRSRGLLRPGSGRPGVTR